MSNKKASNLSNENVLRDVHSQEDNSLITNGYLVAKVGRRIESVDSTTNVAGDTQTITFIEDGVTIYVLRVIYTDATQSKFVSAERIA